MFKLRNAMDGSKVGKRKELFRSCSYKSRIWGFLKG